MAQVRVSDDVDEIWKLYVDPPAMGQGHGRCLMQWIVDVARRLDARQMRIDSDPPARSLYQRRGAWHVGHVPSSSVPGRSWPLLEVDLA